VSSTQHNLRTLVIGGAGYIGQHLLPLLVQYGRSVTVLGRRDLDQKNLPLGIKYQKGDFSDLVLLKSLLSCHDEVIHMAYATVPNTSYDNPVGDLLENLPPTVQLFSEIAKKGAKLLLVSSGGAVYGEGESLPINEMHATKPISPYGLTKLTLENYARLYRAAKGLNYLCVRPANAYGVGQLPFKGQGFISTAIASVMKNKPVNIFGETGTVRDYVYVSDLAEGILKVLENGRLGETYNIGSGIGLSNLDIVKLLEPLLTKQDYISRINHLPAREFDVKFNCLDCEKVKTETDWVPKVSFNDGLLMTITWLSEHIEQF
jgi:UDP-glucose 4-epimerase